MLENAWSMPFFVKSNQVRHFSCLFYSLFVQFLNEILIKFTECRFRKISGGAAKWHHCVENWSSKGVAVGTCSKFKNNLKLSIQFPREKGAAQSKYVLPNSRFHQIVPLNNSSSRKPQWRKSVLLTSLSPAFQAGSNKLPAFDSPF